MSFIWALSKVNQFHVMCTLRCDRTLAHHTATAFLFVCTCVCMGAHVCALSVTLHLVFWDKISLHFYLEHTSLGRLADCRIPGIFLFGLPSTGITSTHHHTQVFFLWVLGGSNLYACVYAASTWSTELCPQPCFSLFWLWTINTAENNDFLGFS